MVTELNTPELAGGLAQLLGLPAGLGAAAVAKVASGPDLPESEKRRIEAAEYFRLFETTPKAIADAFHASPTGTLMLYYQLFWPIHIRADQSLKRVRALTEFCEQSESKYEKRQRIRVLPAVAAAHALGHVRESESDELRQLVLTTHDRALDPEDDISRSLSRGILEIIWQNMTAALIRNRRSWERFSVGSDLVTAADLVCRRFLDGEPILLPAAAAALQFLLTYDRALYHRRDSASQAQVQMTLHNLEGGSSTAPASGLVWLGALTHLYRDRSHHSQMLPQLSEAVMGRHAFTDLNDQRAIDFFTLLRLQSTFHNQLIAEGRLRSIYMPEDIYVDQGYAQQMVDKSLTFLSNFGLSPEDWPQLRRLAEELHISDDTIRWLSDRFQQYDSAFHQSLFELSDATWLASWIPFRRLDEERVFWRVQDRSTHIVQYVAGLPRDTEELIQLWRAPLQYTVQSESARRHQEVQEIRLKEVEENKLPVLAREYASAWEFLHDRSQEVSKRRGFVAPAAAWQPSPEEETAAMPETETSSSGHGSSTDASNDDPERFFRELPMERLSRTRAKRLIAMKFQDKASFIAALNLADEHDLPYDVLGQFTLVVEDGCEPFFDSADLPHTAATILPAHAFPAEVRAKLRRKYYFIL